MKNQNESEDKKQYSLDLALFSVITLMLSSVLLYGILSINKHKENPSAKMAEFQIEMNKRAKLAELRSQAPTGSKYDGLVKNEFGFWEDENGFVYEVEFNEGIDVVSPLGKLSKEKQKSLQKEKKEKQKKIEYHKQELEDLGVVVDKKKKSGSAGIPVFDAGAVNVKDVQKMINEAKKQAEKEGE